MDFYEYTKLNARQQISHSNRMDCYISVELIAKNPFLRNKVRFQRMVDSDIVVEIINAQETHLKLRGQFQFPQPIIFGFLQHNKEGYLLDGQHRFHALHHFLNTPNEKMLIPVCVHQFTSMEEMKQFFIELNKHTEISEEIMNADNLDDKEIIEETAKHFFYKYAPIFAKDETKRVRLPKIRKNDFQNMIGMLLKLCKQYNQSTNIIGVIDIINMIEDENKRYSNQDWYNQLKSSSAYRNKVIALAKETDFWLGFSKNHRDYYMNWVLSCFQKHMNIEIISEKSSTPRISRTPRKKSKIPKSLKSAVWNRYIGKQHGEAYCPICKDRTIQKEHFFAGHVVSEHHGGEVSVDNLRPICSLCNSSMSTTNMEEYVKKYHPENYDTLFYDTEECAMIEI